MAKEDSSSVDQGTANPTYEATASGVALLRRRGRRFLAVEGMSPGDMLKGILSGRIPDPLSNPVNGWREGEISYSTVLTPKGKMVSDLRLFPSGEGGFLLDLPLTGLEGALAHFKKYLNPRFAQLRNRSEELGMLTVVGPGGRDLVSGVLGFEVPAPGIGEARLRSGESVPELWALGNDEIDAQVMDLILPLKILEEVRGQMEEAGARPMDAGTWEVLRIEAGTPLYGVDMTEDTIPVEAGIHERAIDYQKGCFTGQEVIIRLRDRGQVNKTLFWIFLGDSGIPESGAELFGTDSGKKVGWVTSACRSPKYGQTIALGFIKRGVGPGDEVRLGGPQGPAARVVDPGGEASA